MSRETEKVLNPEIMKQTQSLVTFEKTDDILQDMWIPSTVHWSVNQSFWTRRADL